VISSDRGKHSRDRQPFWNGYTTDQRSDGVIRISLRAWESIGAIGLISMLSDGFSSRLASSRAPFFFKLNPDGCHLHADSVQLVKILYKLSHLSPRLVLG